jgi:protein-S-isoprenylcysteine O-methyltransferase Ste14
MRSAHWASTLREKARTARPRLFELYEFWVENRVMLELATEDMLPAYVKIANGRAQRTMLESLGGGARHSSRALTCDHAVDSPLLQEHQIVSERRSAHTGLFRALVAFIAMPGVVAFGVPLFVVLQSHAALVRAWGLVPLFAGVTGLLWCVRDFYVAGRGTLAPWAPPERLVVIGLYRYSRNPMYVSVILILTGWGVAFGSRGLLIYALGVALAFHLRVVFGEEPWLARAHGGRWERYKGRVPRWCGVVRRTARR